MELRWLPLMESGVSEREVDVAGTQKMIVVEKAEGLHSSPYRFVWGGTVGMVGVAAEVEAEVANPVIYPYEASPWIWSSSSVVLC